VSAANEGERSEERSDERGKHRGGWDRAEKGVSRGTRRTGSDGKQEKRIGVERSKYCIYCTKREDIVKMCDHEIAVMQYEVYDRVSEYQPSKPSKTK